MRYGDGWIPIGDDPEKLRAPVAELRERAKREGRPTPEVILMTALAIADPPKAADQLCAFAEVGVSHIVHGSRYADAREFRNCVDGLANLLS